MRFQDYQVKRNMRSASRVVARSRTAQSPPTCRLSRQDRR